MLAPAAVELSQLLILFLFIDTFHMKSGYWQNDLMKKCSPIKMHRNIVSYKENQLFVPL